MSDEKGHNPDEERLAKLYRRAANAEPDGRIDQAVLRHALKAVSGRRPRMLRHPGAWGAGLAAAASLVLAVGLVFQRAWQPTPESEQLERFRPMAEMEQADKSAQPVAGDSVKRRDAEEQAALKESAELNRVEVTGARSRQEASREDQESRGTEADEARLAAPAPVEEGEQLSPDAWLERIRELINAGRNEAARQEMREFREAYPLIEIPEAIREALVKGNDSSD